MGSHVVEQVSEGYTGVHTSVQVEHIAGTLYGHFWQPGEYRSLGRGGEGRGGEGREGE